MKSFFGIWKIRKTTLSILMRLEIQTLNIQIKKKNGKLRCNPLGKNPSDVWQIAKVTSGKNRSSKERTPHPAQFPLELIERVVKASSNPGDLILDPFMGSGSTAECALRNGRYAIGFELKSEYIGYTEARINAFLEDKIATEAQVELAL